MPTDERAANRLRRHLVAWAAQPRTELIMPHDSRYERARHVYNRIHDCFPAALVRSPDPVRLSEVLHIARDHGVSLAIRGGGHHIAGFATCEGGIVIDLSPFRRVKVA